MLQLDRCNYYEIMLLLLCHYIATTMKLCCYYCAIILQLLCNYTSNNVLMWQWCANKSLIDIWEFLIYFDV
jgi:hypothetical protein